MTWTWRLWIDGKQDGETNMRRDREMLAALDSPDADDSALPTLRLYAWQPWTVSLGKAQDPARALDLAEVTRRGYGWVRRPTGGRAVFHAEEITYAVAAPFQGPFASGLAETHRRIALALARFYRAYGAEPTLSRPAPPADLDPRSSAPCFLSPGLAELELDGRKLAGSAQRRGRRAFLQHGSLPLGPAQLELADLLPLDDAARERVKRNLAERSTCLADLLDPLPTRRELHARLAAAFASEFGIRWV